MVMAALSNEDLTFVAECEDSEYAFRVPCHRWMLCARDLFKSLNAELTPFCSIRVGYQNGCSRLEKGSGLVLKRSEESKLAMEIVVRE